LLEEQQYFSSLPLFNDGSKKSVIDDVSPSSLIPHERANSKMEQSATNESIH
jgi:hypothetical protein